VARGTVLLSLESDLIGAEAEFRRALELAPQNPLVSHNLALLLTDLGRLDEAVAHDRQAIVLDPLRSTVQISLAVSLTALGRYDEAEAALRNYRSAAVRGDLQELAMIQILRGKPGGRGGIGETKPILSGGPTPWR
jgi:Flp pilus assembly protein TadD